MNDSSSPSDGQADDNQQLGVRLCQADPIPPMSIVGYQSAGPLTTMNSKFPGSNRCGSMSENADLFREIQHSKWPRDQWIKFTRKLLGLRPPIRRGKGCRKPCFELPVPVETPQRASELERWTNKRFPTPSVAVSPLEARVALSPRMTTQGTQTDIRLIHDNVLAEETYESMMLQIHAAFGLFRSQSR